MPRKPTGKPPGRPKGSGRLGEQTRLTVRVPTILYDRLEAFAAGRRFHRASPQLAWCVREALEEYLDRHSKRQTQIVHDAGGDSTRQTQTAHTASGDSTRQTGNGSAVLCTSPTEAEDNIRQTITVPVASVEPLEAPSTSISQTVTEHETVSPHMLGEPGEGIRQTENAVPAYDISKYVLGKLCPRGHEWGTTGQSLLSIASHSCKECKAEDTRKRRQAKRQAQPA